MAAMHKQFSMTIEVELVGVKNCLSRSAPSTDQVLGNPDSDSDSNISIPE